MFFSGVSRQSAPKIIVFSESLTWGPGYISLSSWTALDDHSLILMHKEGIGSLGLQMQHPKFDFPRLQSSFSHCVLSVC